jgi:uncharacterized damage-inducible protein DinB
MTASHYLALWQEARTRFSNQLQQLTAQDLSQKLGTSPNSVGFLIRHIADVELLFTKNVFKKSDVQVVARTVIDKRDTGQWTDLADLLAYQQTAFEQLQAAILATTDWDRAITTPEFGTKTKAEALGRIVSHTAYHADNWRWR